MNKPTRTSFSIKRVIKVVLVVLLALFMIACLYVIGYIIRWQFIDPVIERASVQEVKQQVALLPTVHIEQLQPWEGDTMVTLSIKNKGQVHFWYAKGGPPRIDSISPIKQKSLVADFQCQKRSLRGTVEPAYTIGLVIEKDEALGKFFPFEVRTIPDLVRHYDDIFRILRTFPLLSPTLIDDLSTDPFVLKNPDPKYAFTLSYGDSATCYRYMQYGE